MALGDQVIQASKWLDEYRRNEISRREFIGLMSLLSAAAVAASCSIGSNSSGPSGKSGPVTVPLYSAENDPGSMAFYAAAAVDFKKLHPNVTIQVNFFGSSATFLEAAFLANHDVGIFEPNIPNIPGWAQAGNIIPVDDIINGIGASDFIAGTRVQLNGHDWAVPFQKSSSGLWYRKDALEAVGISGPPATFDDLVSTLKEVHGRNGMIGISMGADSTVGSLGLFCLLPFVLQQGWGYFDKNGNLTFNQPEVLAGVQNFATLATKYSDKSLYAGSFSEVSTAYVNGRAVFCLETGRPGNTITINNPKIAAVTGYTGPPPAGPVLTGKVNFGFAKNYCIDAKTQSPDDAKAFLQFITSGKNALLYALTVPGQPLPALKSVAAAFTNPATPEIAANKFMQMPNYREWVSNGVSLVPYACNEQIEMGAMNSHKFQQLSNVNPWAPEVWGANAVDTVMIQEIVLSGQDPQAAWKKANDQLANIRLTWLSQNPGWKPST